MKIPLFFTPISKRFQKVFSLTAILIFLLSFSFLVNRFAFAFIDRLNTAPAQNMPPGAVIFIDQQILNAVIQVESSNNPNAYNRRTQARGLTQITPITWKELKRRHRSKYAKLNYWKDIYNPDVAREAGKDYLYILQKILQAKRIPITWENLLAAYVWGPGNLSKYGMQKAPRVVKRYIKRVKHLAKIVN